MKYYHATPLDNLAEIYGVGYIEVTNGSVSLALDSDIAIESVTEKGYSRIGIIEIELDAVPDINQRHPILEYPHRIPVNEYDNPFDVVEIN